MALHLLTIPPGNQINIVDEITGALVEAASLAAAKVAAVALDSRLTASYFDAAGSTIILSDTATTSYQGGLLREVVLDNGVA